MFSLSQVLKNATSQVTPFFAFVLMATGADDSMHFTDSIRSLQHNYIHITIYRALDLSRGSYQLMNAFHLCLTETKMTM